MLQVYEVWYLMVMTSIAIATVACEYEHVLLMAKLYGARHRYTVGYSTIEHRHPVHHNYLTHIWQRA